MKERKSSMKKNQCVPGTVVVATIDCDEWSDKAALVKYHDTEYGDNDVEGVILDKPSSSPDCVFVDWGQHDWSDDLLGTDVEVSIKLLTLKSDLPKLESEFKALQKEVRAKCKDAAKLIAEANKMAKKGGQRDLYELDSRGILYDAMNKAGWQMSSIDC